MPIKLIRINNMKGFQYGKTGKVYTGRGAKEKARVQGKAIELNRLRKEGRLIERDGEIIEIKSSKRARGYKRKI